MKNDCNSFWKGRDVAGLNAGLQIVGEGKSFTLSEGLLYFSNFEESYSKPRFRTT